MRQRFENCYSRIIRKKSKVSERKEKNVKMDLLCKNRELMTLRLVPLTTPKALRTSTECPLLSQEEIHWWGWEGVGGCTGSVKLHTGFMCRLVCADRARHPSTERTCQRPGGST